MTTKHRWQQWWRWLSDGGSEEGCRGAASSRRVTHRQTADMTPLPLLLLPPLAAAKAHIRRYMYLEQDILIPFVETSHQHHYHPPTQLSTTAMAHISVFSQFYTYSFMETSH